MKVGKFMKNVAWGMALKSFADRACEKAGISIDEITGIGTKGPTLVVIAGNRQFHVTAHVEEKTEPV